MENITIGISDCGRYETYANWISNAPGVQVIKLSYKNDPQIAIDKCDGIVITGGQDVHPRYYNMPQYLEFYKGTVSDIDEKRDAFELDLLERSVENQLPLLGICRGLQVANVFFGGTLVLDIPALGKRNHSKIQEGEDRYHNINLTPGSVLENISGSSSGTVNSAHHQSALQVADRLLVSALSDDGVIEALERKDFYNHAYLMLVQWHPERMTDQQSVFSLNIKNSFLDAVRKVKQG